MGTTDPAVVLQPLLDELAAQIRVYEQSRVLHLSPAERSQRIRAREAWIAAIQALIADAAEDA